MKRFRPRLSYANVVATMALFLALAGGTVWAANKINGKQIKKNTIPGNRIKKNTLTANQIKKQTITNNQIKPGSIQRTRSLRLGARGDHRGSLGDESARCHDSSPARADAVRADRNADLHSRRRQGLQRDR